MMHTIPATAAMLVKNSERYLSEVLSALKDFDEVLLLDNGSTDRTFEIAKGFPNPMSAITSMTLSGLAR